MKKKLAVFITAIVVAGIIAPHSSIAAPVMTYDSVAKQYGSTVSQYTSIVKDDNKDINCIYCNGIRATVKTDTNIRTTPNADSERVIVINDTAEIMIWGITENEWAKVYCNSQGENYFGFIKGDLLNLH